MRLSKRLDQFPEYIFSELGKKKKELEKRTGKTVLDFSIGSPDYPPSKIYTKKLKEFIDDSKAHIYPGYGANEEFEKGLQSWYKKRFGVELKSNELFPLLGGKDGVSHLPLALLDTGDEALIPDPGYPGFTGPVLMLGAKPVFYNLTEKKDFKIDLKDLENKITKKTKYMWINFPSNPTGQIVTLEELKPIVALAKKHNILLIYDNAYAEITFDGYVAPSILEIPGAKDVAVEIGSFSKSHSFAGHRMGWIVGNPEVIKGLAKVKSQLDSGMFTPLMKLGGYALEYPDLKWKASMLSDYKKRRDIIAEKLRSIGLVFELPKGGLYIWAKIPNSEKDSLTYCFKLLDEKHILLAPGTAFGENGKEYVRVCISSNITNIENYF